MVDLLLLQVRSFTMTSWHEVLVTWPELKVHIWLVLGSQCARMMVQKVKDGGVVVPTRVANGVAAIDGWMGLPWLGRGEEELVVCCRDGGR